MLNSDNYSSGHPWYYKLGGEVKPPKLIMIEVRLRGYKGHMADDIEDADCKPEPKRSELLRQIRKKVMNDLKRDISQYREVARELHMHRKTYPFGSKKECSDGIHGSAALKYNHLSNDFAHLILLDELLSKQPDLFD